MATVTPFRGVTYNTSKIGSLRDVVTPPFDVISPSDQEAFYARHPKNIVRVILGKAYPGDSAADNPHTRAAAHFNQWLADGILVRDAEPTLYLTAMEFIHEGRPITRFGLIARVGLEPFEKGIVLPHERTFSRVKSERLNLMKASHANFSPIFGLYPDGNGLLDLLRTTVSNQAPALKFTERSGFHHSLWRITAPRVQQQVTERFAGNKIFIADGHHRYETALNYRDWVAANTPGFSAAHPANHVMMYLCSMTDPGLIILPAHRMLKAVSAADLAALPEKATPYFDIRSFVFDGQDRASALEAFTQALRSNTNRSTIGAFSRGSKVFHLFTLKPNVMADLFAHELDAALRDIDVTVLTRLILMEFLGFDQARLDNENLIGYATDAAAAVETVDAGDYDVTFILNPTKIEQVRRIAEAGQIMPRKATYFYPKVVTGQVMNLLTP